MAELHLTPLLEPLVGSARADALVEALRWPTELEPAPVGWVTRTEIALGLAALLFEDVQRRVPSARAYVAERLGAGRRLWFDHGALRTVAAPSGDLPVGIGAFTRLLEPLGYRMAGTYPLEALGMTGYAFAHDEASDAVPQYFVSELHPERFSPAFQEAVARVVGASRDPLRESARTDLAVLAREGSLPLEEAARLLPDLFACFDRQHPEPSLEDYALLLEESPEMAWIATEGNAFNHATDRVDDVFAVAEEQRRLGRPVKAAVEVSRNGRVLQTAFRAAPADRLFRDDAGRLVVRSVPGSFHEFITRHRLEDGALDLTFDAANATSIFGMTSTEGAR